MQWILSADDSINKIIIEKSTNAIQFAAIGEVWINTEAANGNQNGYIDNAILTGTTNCLLKMIEANGKVQYSNVLVFRSDENKKTVFKMYPSVIIDNSTVNVTPSRGEQTKLQVVDLGGRSVFQRDLLLQAGDNNVTVSGFSNRHQGTYIAVVQTSNTTNSQKIMIQ